MPEAAEVELTRRALLAVVGQRLAQVDVLDDRLSLPVECLTDVVLADVLRHGKRLAFRFASDGSGPELLLVCHLRMTGSLTSPTESITSGLPSDLRAVLEFEDRRVFFRDRRRLGSLRLMPSGEWQRRTSVDLLSSRPEAFRAAARSSSRHARGAKALMLDQTGPIAGAGNYLVDETLFLAGIHPMSRSDHITEAAWERLWWGCRRLAQRALRSRVLTHDAQYGESPFGDYSAGMRCYGRAGLPCVVCGSALVRDAVARRGTTFCPVCQPLARSGAESLASVIGRPTSARSEARLDAVGSYTADRP